MRCESHEAINFDEITLTINDLAKVLKKSPKTISNYLYLNDPNLLPPCVVVGAKRRLWLYDDVMFWLRQRYHPQYVIAPKKRGRPRKLNTLIQTAQQTATTK